MCASVILISIGTCLCLPLQQTMGPFHCSTTAVYLLCGDGVGVWYGCAPLCPPAPVPAGHYSLRLLLRLVLCYSAMFHTPVTRSGVFNRAVVRC